MFPLEPGGPSTPATPCEDKSEKTHVHLIAMTGSGIRQKDGKGDGTYRRSRGSWRTTRSQQTSRTLRRMRSNIKCYKHLRIIFRRAIVSSGGYIYQREIRHQRSLAKQALRGSCCNMLESHMLGISWWNKTNSRQALRSRQLILWARSLHPRPEGRKRQSKCITGLHLRVFHAHFNLKWNTDILLWNIKCLSPLTVSSKACISQGLIST